MVRERQGNRARKAIGIENSGVVRVPQNGRTDVTIQEPR